MGNNTCPKCACNNCNNIGVYPICLDRRGGRNIYLCELHYDSSGDARYHTSNTLHKGTYKANGDSYGYEMETSKADSKARAELLAEGFIPTCDSSIPETEFVSPMYHGLGGLSAFTDSIDKLLENGNMRIGNTCGTHVHIGNTVFNESFMECLAFNYGLLFYELSNRMESDVEKTKALFGRYFNGYCKACDSDYQIIDRHDHYERYYFINVLNSNRIEYRLCKFQSGKQFINCVKFCREINRILIKHFLPTVIENGYCKDSDPVTGAARKTGKKLEKLFLMWDV